VLADADGALLGEAEDLSRLPTAVRDQARSARVAGAARFDVEGGEPVLAAYDTVAGTPWFVVSSQPAAAAEQVAVRMRRGAWFAVGVAVLLTAALSLVAYGSLVRPLRSLVRTQRSLAGLTPEPGGGNEIEELRRSFAALERSLRDRQALDEVFLGRYQVLEVLGEGGMGTVFRGWDPRLERPVALKTLRLAASRGKDDTAGAEQLVGEAVLAAQFQHPNVVAVYDVEDTPEVSFIAMELIDGLSLETVIDRLGRVPPADVARVGEAMARGLAAAHHRGVVHRDVKPANVLLGRDGSIKVTDFGIAAVMTRLAGVDNRVYGTPGFVAPEVLIGEAATPGADLFALGVVLYTCLVGESPFVGRNVKEILLDTLRRQPTPPEDLVPALPTDLSGLCMELLDKNPGQRPSDGERLAAQLGVIADRLGAETPLGCLRKADSPVGGAQHDIGLTTQTSSVYLLTGRVPDLDRRGRPGRRV
jgi:HAMP domain-containing protein